MVPERLEREILIDAPPDIVWSVITEPEHLGTWFGDSAEIDLRPGGELLLRWDGTGGRVQGRVERVEPPRVFSFRWIRDEEGNSTLVEFSLSAEGETTRLTVVETGFQELAWPEERKQKDADAHRAGWKQELGELEDYVRAGLGTSA
jgi:uncharacterized protein YndB with AHSA1/START domain